MEQSLFFEICGWVGSITMILGYLPQAIYTIRTRDTDGIALPTFLMIGCAWAAMLAMPFTFVTNALQGYGHMGAYLGLFNGTICIPHIVAAICGGAILSLIGHHQSSMMLVAGVSFLIASACVFVIKVKK